MKKLSLVIGLLLMFSSVFAQNEITIQAIKQISVASSVLNGKQDIKASHYRLVEIDMQALRAGLKQAAHQNSRRKKADVWLQLPMPNGKMMSYRIVENSTMAPGLAAKYQSGGTNLILDVLQALPTLFTDIPPVNIPVPV